MGKSFIFGGDTNLTYDELKQKQKYADQMMARGASGQPRTAIQGANSAANSILGALIAKRSGEKLGEGRQEATSAFQSLLGGGFGGGTQESQNYNAMAAFGGPTNAAGAAANGDRELLAKTLEAEAGGEGLNGMLAAGAVIRNRANAGGYGDGINGVIMKPGQFSAWNGVTGYAGGKGAIDMGGITPSEDALKAADAILSGNFQDPTGGATHYYNPNVANPKWGQKAGGDWTQIGNHVFGFGDGAGRGGGNASNGSGVNPELMQAMADPYMSQEQKSVLGMLLQQQIKASQPVSQMDQLQMERLQLQNEQLRNPAEKPRNIVKGADGFNYYPDTGERVFPNVEAKQSTGASYNALEAQAQAAGLVPGTPDYQQFMFNGGGNPATFRALDMQAQAAGLVPDTPEYKEFMATRGAGAQAYAKGIGGYQADIELGGNAAATEEVAKATVASGVSAWEDYGKLQKSIGTIGEAISAIDSGAESGVVYKYLPNITEASASLNNAMDRMGLDVIGSVTFGALSEGEMKLAMNTAVPRNLSPEELRSWLVKKQEAQQKAAAMLADAAQFMTTPGNTINDWIKRNRSLSEAQSGGSGLVPQDTAVPDGVDPALWQVMTPEERALFQ